MKNYKKIRLFCALAVVGMLAVLMACAPQTASSDDSSESSADAGDYAPASMMAVHQDGVIDPDKEYEKKDCLSCHPRDTIEAANADYGGESGVNPHASHTEAYNCTVCHSITDVSSMKCNACHDWLLPEGWENPPKETSVDHLRR